jgi:hypothetical protein
VAGILEHKSLPSALNYRFVAGWEIAPRIREVGGADADTDVTSRIEVTASIFGEIESLEKKNCEQRKTRRQLP